MRIIFMGTPDFSVSVLNALVAAGHDIACAYCQPPRPAGRGKKLRPTPVHARAEALGIEVRHPTSLKTPDAQADFAALDADIAVVVAYGLILPTEILEAPRLGCLNIHASLLPRWRGAAPIHRAIMAGDAQSGVCIMQMDAGLDTGPVLLQRDLDIAPHETTGSLHDKLSLLGAQAIVDALSKLPELTATPQPETGVTYAAKIDKSEARVDWTRPAELVDQQIRGLSPFPGAWSELDDTRIKFLQSHVTIGQGPAGTVLTDDLTIACGTGAIKILSLQKAGRGPKPADEFLRGWAIKPGQKL